MEKKLSCLRCGRDMVFLRREHLQLGKTGLFTGDWGNLLAGALDVAILQCPGCGKLEFFKGDAFEEKDEEALKNAMEEYLKKAAVLSELFPTV